MFIENIHFVKYQKRVIYRIGRVVWLKAINHIEDSAICDSIYFSLVSGNVVFLDWSNLNNWKFDPSGKILPIGFTRRLPNNMIQDGSQVMDNLTSKDAEPQWDNPLIVILDCLKEELFVVLRENCVFAVLKERFDLGLKITNVLVCPF